MLDRQIIEQHLQNMEEALTNLGRYQDLSLEKLGKDLNILVLMDII